MNEIEKRIKKERNRYEESVKDYLINKDKEAIIANYLQVEWERDVAIHQLLDLGYSLGQKSENKSSMWIVTYWDEDDSEPVVTVFDNQEAADSCYSYFKNIHDGCCLDNVTVCHSFKAV